MNKYLCALAALVMFCACSSDEEIPAKDPEPKPDIPVVIPPVESTSNAEIGVARLLTLDPKLNLGGAATYEWSVTSAPDKAYSLTRSNEEKALLFAHTAGQYILKLQAKKEDKSYIHTLTLTVHPAATPLSPYIAKVYDLLLAPGQFTNTLPEFVEGDTRAEIVKKAGDCLVGKKNGALMSLGGFGGYIVFGFDHTIENVQGKRDLRIMANAFYSNANPNPDASIKGGSCEPGIVMVAYDVNGNGEPDDAWYEIAGSEYNKPATIHNYEITYFRPTTEEADETAEGWQTIAKYIRWEDNQGHSGYKAKNMFHNQTYYPQWIKEDQITFRGTLLANNAVDESGDGSYWVLYSYGFGYADNALNNEDDSAIDIDWAVDANGAKVHLPGVDFVKVYTATNQECGWLGESSTEIAGAYDLHIANEVVESVK